MSKKNIEDISTNKEGDSAVEKVSKEKRFFLPTKGVSVDSMDAAEAVRRAPETKAVDAKKDER